MSQATHDYYKTLQVDCDAEPEIIEAAFKRLIRMYHPDLNNSPDATRRMQEINAAYDVLKDPTQRARYDRERRAAGGSARSGPQARSGGPTSEALYFTFLIVSAENRKAIGVSGATQKDGAPLLLGPSRGMRHQLWRFEPLSGADHGYCRIRSINSSKCLAVTSQATGDGMPVVQWSCLDSDDQKWKLIDVGGSFVIQSRHSGKVLDAARTFAGIFQPVVQWSQHGDSNQRWYLIKP